MKFTLLPDMEAKKENRQRRKRLKRERKLARNDRRRRKVLSKRDSFWKIFIKRWVVLIIVSAIICAAGTYMVERENYQQVKRVYESWKNGIYHNAVLATYELDSCEDIYTDEEKQAMFRARVRASMYETNYNNMYDFSATMYEVDYDKGVVNKVCDSQEGIVLAVHRYDDVSSSKTMFYECPIEAFGDIDIGRYDFDSNLGIYDCYIKGTEFRPGVVGGLYTSEDGSIIKHIKYDLTPENTEGWFHIDSEKEREKRFAAAEGKEGGYPYYDIILYIGGTKKDSPAYVATNTIEYEYFGDGKMAISYGIDASIGRSDLENYMTENELYSWGMYHLIQPIKWESMGKKYFIHAYGYYNFYDYHMDDCIRVYCIVAMLVTVLALLMARSRWIRVKTQYEIEDYRKSLTDAMAHDLKSPLMALSGFAENLKDNVHTEKRGYYADVISENVNYMNSIIERILELSKTEANDMKLKRESIELQTLFDEVISKYEGQIDKKKLTVDTEGDITINADRQLMLQAIDNLIFNAIKFSNDETVINIVCDKTFMTISNAYTANEDEPDELDLLKPFVKGSESRSNKSGSGVGLTIAKNIFELHGYKLSLKRAEGKFIVRVDF
ncbi:MAG: HAMP domain-containing histidine kinase [Lachnospiraceae bacterium]|nr:HAMP domain-containing histidine kinase [Lachnospiraceae bacterium]